MKIILYSIALLITAFLLIVVIKICAGEPVKLFGIEINYDKKPDTTKKFSGLIGVQVSNVKKDTPKIFFDKNKPHFLPVKKQQRLITIPLPNKIPDTNKVQPIQKFEFKAPVTAPSQFGNGNTQVNQITGKIDRHPDEKLVYAIFGYLPNKNNGITISYETPDIESKNFSNELKSILESNGYRNITLFGHLEIGTPQQAFPIMVDTAHYGISIELNGINYSFSGLPALATAPNKLPKVGLPFFLELSIAST